MTTTTKVATTYGVRLADTGEYIGSRDVALGLDVVPFAFAWTTEDRAAAERMASMSGLPDAEVVVLEKDTKGRYNPRLSRPPAEVRRARARRV